MHRSIVNKPTATHYQPNSKMNVPFWFLTDLDNNVTKQIDIHDSRSTPSGMEIFGYESDTVSPTVVITEESGLIIYINQTDNYRVRPDLDTFLSVIEKSIIS